MRVSQQVQEWQSEGRVEGELKRQRMNLLRLLEMRGKGPVPKDLMDPIQTTEDMDLLSRWFDAAAEANSLDDFRAAVQR